MNIKKTSLRLWFFIGIITFTAFYAGRLFATDPPHRDVSPGTDTGWCGKCHTPHSQLGTGYGVLSRVEGNANLCISCHNTGGRATNKPFTTYDQAALGDSSRLQGWSHRWDSGVGGYVDNYSVSTGTSGRIISGIVGGASYTFRYTIPRIYEIRVSTTGNVGGGGNFQWRWSSDSGQSWSGYSAGTAMTTQGIRLNTAGAQNGDIKVSFQNGGTFPSFAAANDVFRVYVRPEITYPTNSAIRNRMFKDPNVPTTDADDPSGDGYRKMGCSSCHNQHSQARTSSDPTSSITYISGSANSADRHFQRINNMTNSMCLDCHSVRSVTDVKTWAGGNTLSHPVGISLPATSMFHTVPFEPSNASTEQTAYSYRGYATVASANTRLYDDNRSFSSGAVGKIIRFTTGTKKNTTKTITAAGANYVDFAAAGTANTSINDKYEIDADGNLSNNLRLYNPTTGLPSFTAGQVMCLSCHNIHWGDSNETSADVP